MSTASDPNKTSSDTNTPFYDDNFKCVRFGVFFDGKVNQCAISAVCLHYGFETTAVNGDELLSVFIAHRQEIEAKAKTLVEQGRRDLMLTSEVFADRVACNGTSTHRWNW